jgi:APA family basic amino acid/polyamine antiporter
LCILGIDGRPPPRHLVGSPNREIGTGVFTTLGWQILDFSHGGNSLLTGSVFPVLMLWVVGGVLALCGALCYAELATALPRSGGEYNFLSRIYHPMLGFCTGFCSASIGFAAPIAASGLFFGDYFCRAFPACAHLAGNNTAHLMGFVLVTAVTLCHLRSLRFTGRFQATVTGLTVLLILVFIVVGFGRAPSQPVTFLPHATDWNWPLLGAFGGSLIWVMYSYSGWNAASYIVEEVSDPGRALPRALILGTVFVLLLYVGVNAVFLYTTPLDVLSGKPEVAHLAGTAIFGPVGARISSGLICIGLIANVSGMMWVGSRVSQAIGANYPALGLLGRTSATRIPVVALLYQYAIVFVILFFNPDQIVSCVSAVLVFWSLLAVLGVIVLRVREPNLPRPYRTWGYPVTPLVFAAIAIFCLVQNFQDHFGETLVGAATVLIGIPIYLWARRSAPGEPLDGGVLPESST